MNWGAEHPNRITEEEIGSFRDRDAFVVVMA